MLTNLQKRSNFWLQNEIASIFKLCYTIKGCMCGVDRMNKELLAEQKKKMKEQANARMNKNQTKKKIYRIYLVVLLVFVVVFKQTTLLPTS